MSETMTTELNKLYEINSKLFVKVLGFETKFIDNSEQERTYYNLNIYKSDEVENTYLYVDAGDTNIIVDSEIETIEDVYSYISKNDAIAILGLLNDV